MAKLVNEGENRVLNILFVSTAVDANLYLGLFTNSSEPAETDALAQITEPSGNGYARIALARGTWSVTDDLASYAQQTFTALGAWGNVYGYFIATSTDGSGKLMFVETFANGPYNVQNSGDEIKVTPKIRAA